MTELEKKFIVGEIEKLKEEQEKIKNLLFQIERRVKDQKDITCRSYIKTDKRLKLIEKKVA